MREVVGSEERMVRKRREGWRKGSWEGDCEGGGRGSDEGGGGGVGNNQ